MGPSGGDAPEASPEQRALQSEQAATVRQQREVLTDILRKADLLSPELFQEIGLTPLFEDDSSLDAQIAALEQERSGLSQFTTIANNRAPSPLGPPQVSQRRVVNPRFGQIDKEIASLESQKGKIIGFDRVADPTANRLETLEDALFDRTEKALAGEISNPLLERQLEERRNTFENSLIRDFGSLEAARNSTAGQNRINAFEQFSLESIDQANRRDIEQGRIGALQTVQGGEALRNNFLSNAQGILNLGTPLAQGLGNASQNFASAIAPLQQQLNTQAQFEANQTSFAESLGGIAGTFGGALLANPALPSIIPSSVVMKENFEDLDVQDILQKLKKLKIQKWNYKGHPKKLIGGMAQKFGELFEDNPEAETIPIASAIGATMASVQAVDEKIDKAVETFEKALKRSK